MKFSINQSEFYNALTVVSKGVSTRSTLPILSGILIKALDNCLTLESSDMNQSIRCSCVALIEEEGECVVPGKLLLDVVKSLDDAAIHLSSQEESVTILCDTSSFSLKTFDASDFPGFPEIEEESSAILPYKIFSSIVKRVARVVSRDDSRPILSGVLLDISGNNLRMVATDSYRLALEEISIEQENKEFSAVVPGIFLNDLAALAPEYETIELGLTDNQIIARYGSCIFINRRIEGNYPNYNQLLPDGYETKITFQTQQLIEATKRMNLVSNNTAPIRFDIDTTSQTTQLSSTSQERGASQETIGSVIEGDSVQIAFNANYLIDGLSLINSKEVFLELQSGVKPGIFKTSDNNYIYLLMPVRLS